jgi:hypothetical protein
MSLVIAVLCLCLGFDIYTGWRKNRDFGPRLEETKAKQQSEVLDAYGGAESKIVFFYAVPGTIGRGQKAQLCYGVINSEKVRIEPPVDNAFPAVSNCVEVTPKSKITYELIAEDAKGNTRKAETTVDVK